MFGARMLCWILCKCYVSWLSHMMDVGPSCTYPTSVKSYVSQIASFVQWLVVMYPASIINNAMVVSCISTKWLQRQQKIHTPWWIAGHLHLPPNPHHKILSQYYPCIRGIIWSPKCLSNTSWYVLWPSNAVNCLQHESAHRTHCTMQYRPCGHHCIHKKPYLGLV